MLHTDLIDLINRGGTWAFVGSGVSIDSGFPSWSELVQGTIECLDENKKQEIVRNKRYQSAFSKGHYARCFSIIETAIERTTLENLVTAQLESVQKPLGKIVKYLADWPFAGYITTNYDGLIKRTLQYTQKQEYGWLSIGNSPDEVQQVSGDIQNVIWHIHGATSLPNDKSQLVLTEKDYDDLYLEDSPVIDKLRGLLTHNRVVFIGFGFGDPEVQRLLKRVGRLCSPARPAFAFLSDIYNTDQEQERLDLLERYNIDVIPYQEVNNSHERLHQLFDVYNAFVLSRSLQFGKPMRPCPSYDSETTGLLVYNELVLRSESTVTEDVLKSLLKSRILSLLQYRESITIEELCSDLQEKIRAVRSDSDIYSDKSYETILQCIGELSDEDFIYKIELLDELSVSLSQNGSDHVVKQAKTAERLSKQFSVSLQDRAQNGFPNNPDAIGRIAQTAETFLKECVHKRGLGVAMSWYSSSVDFRRFHIVALLQDLPDYTSQLSTPEEGLVLISLIEDILSKPNEIEAKFLGLSLQAQFGVHLLGYDPQVFQARVRELSRTLFLIDSSTLIPLLGRSSASYHSTRLLFDRLEEVKSSITTTQMLAKEVAEHARWAINCIKQDNSFLKPETLILMTGRTGTRNNVFLEGFIEEVHQGNIPRDFSAYLDSVCNNSNGHSGKDSVFISALENINVTCLNFEDWEGFTQNCLYERDLLQEKIRELRIDKETYRHERQVKAEAEALIIIRNLRDKTFTFDGREMENAYFISNTRVIDGDGIQSGTPITIRPEAITQWLSTITPCTPDELRFLFDGLFGELSERGFTIVDKSRLQTVFSPLIDASKNKLQEELARHRTLIAQRYGERAEEAFGQVSDLDASTVMHSFYAQRTEELELRLERMSTQTRTNLSDKDRQELEILRSEKAFRKQRELKRKRAAESNPKKKKRRKRKSKPGKKSDITDPKDGDKTAP